MGDCMTEYLSQTNFPYLKEPPMKKISISCFCWTGDSSIVANTWHLDLQQLAVSRLKQLPDFKLPQMF